MSQPLSYYPAGSQEDQAAKERLRKKLPQPTHQASPTTEETKQRQAFIQYRIQQGKAIEAVTPTGYQVSSWKETDTGLDVTFVPSFKDVYITGNAMLPRPMTAAERKRAQEAVLRGEQPFQTLEGQALTRFGAATTIGVGVTVPVAGAFGLGAVGAGEAVKYAAVKKHLTFEEAITAAGVGELFGIGVLAGAKALSPKVQASVDASYKQSVENVELWKPSLTQRVGMKVTGVRAPRLAQEIVGAGEPQPISLSMLQAGKISGVGEDYFFDMPTPRSTQAYVRGYPSSKSWVDTTLIKSVQLEGLFTTVIPQRLLLETETKLEPKMPFIPEEPYYSVASQSSLRGGLLTTFALPTLQRQTTRQKQVSKAKQSTVLNEILGQSQAQQQRQSQFTAQIERQMLGTRQAQTQVQRQSTVFPVPSNLVPAIKVPSMPYFPRGGGSDIGRGGRGIWGSWYPRKHNVKTWQQQFKTFGLGKPPKSLSGLSKVNGFGDFGKSFKPKRNRRKRRRSKR